MKTNSQLQHDVQKELEWDPKLQNVQIGVTAKNGIVTLSGYVNSYIEKIAAEAAARRVSGVLGIAEDIEVILENNHIKTDTEIAEAAVNSLLWNTTIPHQKIKVTVDNGWITLTGNVDWQYEAEDAQKALEGLSGVKGIVNEISVQPKISPDNLKTEIENAIERNAILDAQNVLVKVERNKVVLEGKVNSWFEYEEAENVAWSASGVSEVENKLIVCDPNYFES